MQMQSIALATAAGLRLRLVLADLLQQVYLVAQYRVSCGVCALVAMTRQLGLYASASLLQNAISERSYVAQMTASESIKLTDASPLELSLAPARVPLEVSVRI